MKRVSESSLEVEKKRQTTVTTHLNKFADTCNVCCVLCPLLPSINFSLSLSIFYFSFFFDDFLSLPFSLSLSFSMKEWVCIEQVPLLPVIFSLIPQPPPPPHPFFLFHHLFPSSSLPFLPSFFIPSSLFSHTSPLRLKNLSLSWIFLSDDPFHSFSHWLSRIMDSDGILRIVESGLNHYSVIKSDMSSSYTENNCINLCLQDEDLWRKFNSVVNEMIVTKGGR